MDLEDNKEALKEEYLYVCIYYCWRISLVVRPGVSGTLGILFFYLSIFAMRGHQGHLKLAGCCKTVHHIHWLQTEIFGVPFKKNQKKKNTRAFHEVHWCTTLSTYCFYQKQWRSSEPSSSLSLPHTQSSSCWEFTDQIKQELFHTCILISVCYGWSTVAG